jgi:hypothetical protein
MTRITIHIPEGSKASYEDVLTHVGFLADDKERIGALEAGNVYTANVRDTAVRFAVERV